MAIRFTATLNAFNRGIDTMKPAQAIQMIEDWDAALSEVDVPGAKGLARDLASLRRQLEAPAPDEDRINALLHRLGTATSRIADRSDQSADKLHALGTAISHAGSEQADEDHDAEAAAQPKRRARAA